LAVDGFDNFTPLQATLLAALAQQVEDTRLTLTYDKKREQTVMRIFAHTLERLQSIYPEWQVSDHVRTHELSRSAPLAYLEQQLFALSPAEQPAGDSLYLLEAPDPREEVRMMLRGIKKLLLDGVPPGDIALVMRDVDTYADLLRHTAVAYGVPVQVRQSERVMQNPAVRTIMQLLDLHRLDFPRRQLLDLLRSPYITPLDFSAQDIAELEHISMQKSIVRGRDAWLHGLESDSVRMDEDDDEIIEVSAQVELKMQLENLFDRITPLSESSARDYVSWIEDLLGVDPMADAVDSAELPEEIETSESEAGDFGLYRQIRSGERESVEVRDLYAMHGFRAALAEVLAAYELLADIENGGEAIITSWDSFRADLELAIKDRAISEQANRSRSGRVLITTVFE
ncbi:MAG TPA: hypothetical protein VJZ27_01605, partial [Aggregatilineales bacterium]|nr:hypothetical protein [Aggregatilineales bacterium]